MNRVFKTKKGTELPLMILKGKEYLQVAHRLVYFREEHPDWGIETDFVVLTEKNAIARAVIKDAMGRIIATSHKEESAQDFSQGFREKAETGAIGRALALCGFGTQFEPDLDEGKRVVDSPINNSPPWMEQPGPGDGIADDTYRITFGKFKQRSLEEVGVDDLRNYVNYLEEKSKKDGKEITGIVADFIKRVEEYVGAFENVSN